MAAARSRSSLSLFRLVWIVRKRQPDEKFFPTCFLLLLYYFQFSCLLFLYGWLFSFLDFSFSFLLAFALTGKECAIPTNQMKTCRFISTMWPLTCFFFRRWNPISPSLIVIYYLSVRLFLHWIRVLISNRVTSIRTDGRPTCEASAGIYYCTCWQ